MEVSWKISLLGQLRFSQLLDYRPKELSIQHHQTHLFVCTTGPDGCLDVPPTWPSPFGWWTRRLQLPSTDSRLGWGGHRQIGSLYIHSHISHTYIYTPRMSLFLVIKMKELYVMHCGDLNGKEIHRGYMYVYGWFILLYNGNIQHCKAALLQEKLIKTNRILQVRGKIQG